MRYRVDGIDLETGFETTLVVESNSGIEAAQYALTQGMQVLRVTIDGTTDVVQIAQAPEFVSRERRREPIRVVVDGPIRFPDDYKTAKTFMLLGACLVIGAYLVRAFSSVSAASQLKSIAGVQSQYSNADVLFSVAVLGGLIFWIGGYVYRWWMFK